MSAYSSRRGDGIVSGRRTERLAIVELLSMLATSLFAGAVSGLWLPVSSVVFGTKIKTLPPPSQPGCWSTYPPFWVGTWPLKKSSRAPIGGPPSQLKEVRPVCPSTTIPR